ncbi:cupin domain-containing protein [Naasia lichenicola]|uniref:Cupin domain-containing protein n=1 Tax=Naasia lichenicola TaxID=2565933 RepID=A0A4S4FGK4_9MICO|nr:cupin domain-containing protein [Naasia lichenicola]
MPEKPDVTAPDGSEVRLLASSASGSLSHFTLQPGQVSAAIVHRTVTEMWFVLSGSGRIWRSLDGDESVTELEADMALDLPVGTRFQFRCDGGAPLRIVGVTMPPWPGDDEAVPTHGMWDSPMTGPVDTTPGHHARPRRDRRG